MFAKQPNREIDVQSVMRHDAATSAIVILFRSLKIHGVAQAITDLTEQGAPAFDDALPILAQLPKAELRFSTIYALRNWRAAMSAKRLSHSSKML